ncbi:MAG TPA: pitrilysin family protein, partial [Smithellaceae bacterium]|nr:pitrilysin family protein [Smithellaceae bacterium]
MKHRIGLLYLKSVVLLLAAFNFIALLPPATDAASLPLPDKLVYPPLQFDLPHARRTVLANGIVLYLLENHELPLVNINALIKTGTMHDPEGKEGVAELTAYLMKTGGTKKMSSAELDQHFDFLAASPSISTVADFTQISLALLKKDIDQGIDLLAQMMITPAFEQNKFVLAKGLKNEELRRIKDDPQKLAIREFNRLIHHGSPYGRFASRPSLKNIDRGDLVEFHQEFFHPQNVMIAISGDITFEDALNTISRCFGSWESRSNSARSVFPPQNSRTGLFYINKEISQSTIITGQPAPGKSSPD